MISLLIVDDDEWILKGLKSVINWNEYGFQIIGEAPDGETAYEKILSLKPDVVITDIVMPNLTGLELIDKVMKESTKTEFVILSGYAEFSYAKKACQLGAFDYLLKPLEKEDLLDVLERLRQKYNIMNDVEDDLLEFKGLCTETENPTLKLVLDYINKNYNTKLHLYEVADHFHFNSNYISQLFSRELDMSFSQYLTTYRLHMAEKLLMKKELPLKDICHMVGISDYFYFSKLFKKYKGMSPNSFKASIKS